MLSKRAKQAATNPSEGKSHALVAATRVQRDLDSLSGITAKVDMPDPKNLLNLLVSYSPPDGVWAGGSFNFGIRISEEYPHEAPKVVYLGPYRMFHPNIEGDENKSEWGVCLNILRADWKPVLGLRDIIFGIEMLFFEPNIDDPLPGVAKQAAQVLKDNKEKFKRTTQSWMRGAYNSY